MPKGKKIFPLSSGYGLFSTTVDEFPHSLFISNYILRRIPMKKSLCLLLLLLMALGVPYSGFTQTSDTSRTVSLGVEKAFAAAEKAMLALGLAVAEKRSSTGSALVVAQGKKAESVERSVTPTHLVWTSKPGYSYQLTTAITYLQKDQSKVALEIKVTGDPRDIPLTPDDKNKIETDLKTKFWLKFETLAKS
jgi:hypothetical protein